MAFWLPLPLVPDPLRSGPPVIGLGALFYFASPVNDHTISLDIGTRPGVWQPIVDLEIDLTFGRQQFDIAVQHLYRENGDGSAIETLALGVDHFIQIASYTRFPDTNTLLLGWGSSYSLSVRGLEGTLPFAGTAQNHFLRLSAVGAVRLARLGADTMAVAPLSVSASIRSDFVIVKPFDLYPRSRTRLNLGATMPIASSRNIVGINIDAGFRTAPDRVPSAEAGGVFAPDIGERIVDALFGLRYYSPVAVIDRPLPFGYHLESLRGELFAEAYASALPGISFEQTLYFGAEFEIGFGKTAHLPFGLGIVFRIPLDDVFTPADDIRIYVSSSSILGAFNSK